MCTVVLLRRPDHRWPLLLGANRDEQVDRAWRAPARHWPDRPGIVAGLDEEANGSWLGINDVGVVAGVLNRRHSLGPAAGKRSRGELVLEALDHADAASAANALSELDASSYRPFNLIIADNRDAWWLKGLGEGGDGTVGVTEVEEGISLFTAWDMNDTENSDRTAHYLPRFRAAAPPDPDRDDWADWEALLASRERGRGGGDPNGAMEVVTSWGFGTVSSSLIALPAPSAEATVPRWRFAPAWPSREPYREVLLRR